MSAASRAYEQQDASKREAAEASSCRHEGVLVRQLRDSVNRERDGITTAITCTGLGFCRSTSTSPSCSMYVRQSWPVATAHAGDGLPAFSNAGPFLALY